MFPISSLSLAEKVLHETSGVNVEVTTVALFHFLFSLKLSFVVYTVTVIFELQFHNI